MENKEKSLSASRRYPPIYPHASGSQRQGFASRLSPFLPLVRGGTEDLILPDRGDHSAQRHASALHFSGCVERQRPDQTIRFGQSHFLPIGAQSAKCPSPSLCSGKSTMARRPLKPHDARLENQAFVFPPTIFLRHAARSIRACKRTYRYPTSQSCSAPTSSRSRRWPLQRDGAV